MKGLAKMLLLVAVAVSVTWAGSWVMGRGPPTMVELQDAGAGGASPPAPPDAPPDAPVADPATGGKVVIPEVTQAEIDAAMDEVDKTLAGKSRDAGEAVAETPLPADLAIALPSDI